MNRNLGLHLEIWKGETLYPILGLPLTPDEVVKKYGYVLAGIPIALLKTRDGVVSEINPLANFLEKVNFPFPENYKEIAVSPVKCWIDDGVLHIDAPQEKPELDALVNEVQDTLPAWCDEQRRLQQYINYTQSNMPLADAILGLTGKESFAKAIAVQNECLMLLDKN
ncbi:hypothetical protein AGMMS49965_09780 [Bacteroidia bacterium]|nr:hypothetical protein AGMMS49965_09780 [Bacteroidia bacterium]